MNEKVLKSIICKFEEYLLKAVNVVKIIANTGVRVSEINQITYEMVVCGKLTVNNKVKIREVILNNYIRRDLLKYCKRSNIKTGLIILNRQGKANDRSSKCSCRTNLKNFISLDS